MKTKEALETYHYMARTLETEIEEKQMRLDEILEKIEEIEAREAGEL